MSHGKLVLNFSLPFVNVEADILFTASALFPLLLLVSAPAICSFSIRLNPCDGDGKRRRHFTDHCTLRCSIVNSLLTPPSTEALRLSPEVLRLWLDASEWLSKEPLRVILAVVGIVLSSWWGRVRKKKAIQEAMKDRGRRKRMGQRRKWASEWVSEWVSELVSEWMIGWVSEWVS